MEPLFALYRQIKLSLAHLPLVVNPFALLPLIVTITTDVPLISATLVLLLRLL
jgi:hypothetical protein